MQKLGLFYLAIFTLDCALSIVATFLLNLAWLSNLLSSAVMLSSIAILVVSTMNRLKPKWVYLLLSGSYLAVSFIGGSVVGVLLAAKVGAQGIPMKITPGSSAFISLSLVPLWWKCAKREGRAIRWGWEIILLGVRLHMKREAGGWVS